MEQFLPLRSFDWYLGCCYLHQEHTERNGHSQKVLDPKFGIKHMAVQSCSILNDISVISSKFINKLVQKCQCYYTFLDQSIPLVTVTSVVSLLTEKLCVEGLTWSLLTGYHLRFFSATSASNSWLIE